MSDLPRLIITREVTITVYDDGRMTFSMDETPVEPEPDDAPVPSIANDLDTIERLERWKVEATEVIAQWEECFDALPSEWQRTGLGMLKSDVVRRFVRRVTEGDWPDPISARDDSVDESPTTPPPTPVDCLCEKVLVVPGTRTEWGGISHGIHECYRCTLKGERLRTPPDVGDLWASPEGVKVWDGENWLEPLRRAEPLPVDVPDDDPPCKCGHPMGEHLRERYSCMVSGEEKTWACACTQYRPEREFTDGVR